MTPEGTVKKHVRRILHDKGCYFFQPVQMGYGSPSLDFLVCWRGRFIAVETKAEGKKPTPRQILTMAEITKAGGIAVVVDKPQQLLDLFEMLELAPKP